MSFIFRTLKRFLVKLSPTFRTSRNRFYVDFTNKNVNSATKEKSLKMLDIGGSDGTLSSLSSEGLKSVGKDVFAVVIDITSESLRDGKAVYPSINYLCADVTHLPFRTNTFDIVTSYSVFEHLEQPKNATNEITRVSKGLCVVQIPNLGYFIEPHTKTPVLFLFPNIVRKEVIRITGVPYFINFNVTPKNLVNWFRQAKFNLVDAVDVYHAQWTKLLRTPQGYIYSFRRFI